MTYIKQKVRLYPISSILIVFIWILCLIPIPDNPLNEVRMIDKWTHTTFYATLCLSIYIEYLLRHKKVAKKRLFIGAWLLPTIMGGAIEIVQATCTGGQRSGEWLDFFADTIGSTLMMFIGILLVKSHARYRKDS